MVKNNINTAKVREALADGSYFADARRWYDDIYHRPLAERSFFILITAFAVVTIFFSSLVYTSMQPLTRITPYTIYTDDLTKDIPRIIPLKEDRFESLTTSLARFLVGDYVEIREGYEYDVTQLEWRFNRVRQVSNYDEFARYQEQVNPENPGSPFNKYGRNASREVAIYSKSLNLETSPKTATIYFTTLLRKDKELQTHNWLARITFNLPDYVVDNNNGNVQEWNEEEQQYDLTTLINFEVINYEVQEITQQ